MRYIRFTLLIYTPPPSSYAFPPTHPTSEPNPSYFRGWLWINTILLTEIFMQFTDCVSESDCLKKILFFYSLSLSPDEAITTINCLEPGNPGQSTNLTCTITGVVHSGISWFRPNNRTPQEALTCNYLNTECDLNGQITGYKWAIGHKQNTIIIESFNPATDVGKWVCRDGVAGVPSSCIKKSTCKSDYYVLLT